MPDEYFSVERLTALAAVPPNSRVHVIGVCGVAMAPLAILLAARGLRVSGSDKEFYEPMKTLLAASSIQLCHGYDAQNISADLAFVLIGNSVSADNQEVRAVAQHKLPYTIFPKALYDVVIAHTHSIVVAGTHGKTTTTGLLATALSAMGLDPGFFVGGVVPGLGASLKKGSGKWSVVEGDEYDSAFFAKVPKFSFYDPRTLLITSIEFDHADIYADREAILQEFEKRVRSMKPHSSVVACIDDDGVRTLLSRLGSTHDLSILRYGEHSDAQWRLREVAQHADLQTVKIMTGDGRLLEFSLAIPGRYNAKNALGAVAAAYCAGIALPEFLNVLPHYRGAERRQQVRARGSAILIEDFAHHPTAVRETLRALRDWFPGVRLRAVFEPRSATSRRKIFEKEYAEALANADEACLVQVKPRALDTAEQCIDVAAVAEGIRSRGALAKIFSNSQEIAEYVQQSIRPNDAVVVMSNGSFDGLIDRLLPFFSDT